jgi:exopolysaccharide production protein ExoZ
VAARTVLVNLQICRALAAVIVVIGHSLHDADTIAARAGIDALQSQFNWGFGVDVFFVISGFIMVHVSASDFATPGAPWRFFSRRLIRIVPLYWALTTVLFVGSFIAPHLLNVPLGGLAHAVKSYLFIPDWRPDMSAVRPVMALGWTLNYEMLFYVLFAISMVLPLRAAIPILTLIFIDGVLAKTAFNIEQTQLSFWLDSLILEFLFGVYLALIYRAGWRLPALAAVALAALGVACLTTGIIEAVGLDTDIHILRFGAPAAMLVAAATLAPTLPDSVLTRFGVRLGDASYALYLIHPFIIRPLREIWLRIAGPEWPLVGYSALCTIGAIVAAFALHIFLERPMTRALQKWFLQRPSVFSASRRANRDNATAPVA